MPRGRGNNRGFRPGPPRGRGRGRGKGFRSPFHGGSPGLLDDTNQGTLVFEGDFQDFTLDHVIPPSYRRGTRPARARGGYQTPPRGFRGRGGSGYRGGKAMRGIGFSANSTTASGGYRGPRISLSTLEKDRPLLRPVLFVRGENQKTLFEEVEEILHVPGEEGGTLEDHAPSADLVERLFHQEDPIEELPTDAGKDSTSVTESEEEVEAELPVAVTIHTEETTSVFVIDTRPSAIDMNPRPLESAVDQSMVGSTPLGESIEEETIVYVAPHPRTGRTHAAPASSIAPQPLPDPSSPPRANAGPSQSPAMAPLDSITLDLTPSTPRHPNRVAHAQARTRSGLKSTPRSRKIEKKERAAARRRQERQAMFSSSSFGLSVEEQRTLQDAGSEIAPAHDPRHAERRRNDSDIDWGTDDDDAIEDVRNGIGEMELDPELSDLAVLARFAHGVPGLGTGEEMTIADLDDAAKMREEDEDEEQATDGDGSSQEDDGVFDAEERREIGEGASSDSSDSAEESPGRGFQARLSRLREKAKGRAVIDAGLSSDDQDDTDSAGGFGPGFSWADRDEQFLGEIEDLLDKHADMLHGRDRKSRNKLFRAIQNGDFEDDFDGMDSLNMRKKDRTIPSPLRDQWERDRAKKAERKRTRALARLQAVADASTRKHSGKKQKTFSAARVDGDALFTERVDDLALLEQQIRNFLSNLELKSMVLPPKGKEWRKRVHLLAEAFNLKSKSKGKGDGRFTTLIKTTRSGVGVNERKITRLVGGNRGEGFGSAPRSRGTVRNRDGDEVGKMAPKLSETNIGFKLLQQMGWEEGERIGATGGLVDPLTAIIKTTKRGLGATR